MLRALLSLVFLLATAADFRYRNHPVSPSYYDVFWHFPDVNTEAEHFNGTVTIHLDVLRNTDFVELAAAESMTIQRASLDGKAVSFHRSVPNHPDILSLSLGASVAKGEKIQLSLAFTANFDCGRNDRKHGAFHDVYKKDGVDYGWAITTQFEMSDSRCALPNIDEPATKAVYNVTIVHPDTTEALANGAVVGQSMKAEGCTKVTKFAPTPKMSSYLLAFAVFEKFKKIETKYKEIPITLWSPDWCLPSMREFVDMIPSIMGHFEDYLQTSYQHVKLDQIIHKFNFLGMENWGLVTYSYKQVCSPPNDAAALSSFKTNVRGLFIHEVVHSWFGNLVTCKNWGELWLNEGFTSLFSQLYVADPQLCPGCHHMSIDELFRAHSMFLKQDNSVTHERSVYEDVAWNRDADVVSILIYKKASVVLRFVQLSLGEDVFHLAVQKLMKTYAFSSIVRFDVYNALTEAYRESHSQEPPVNVTEYVDSWITQPSYPIVTMELVASPTPGRKVYRLDQKPYRGNGIWIVPVWYRILTPTTGRRQRREVASNASDAGGCDTVDGFIWLIPGHCVEIKVDETGTDGRYVVLNWHDQTPMYGQMLESERQIIMQMAKQPGCDSGISATGNDAFALARRGEIPYATALLTAQHDRPRDWVSVADLDFHLQDIATWSTDCRRLSKYAADVFGTPEGSEFATSADRLSAAIQNFWNRRAMSQSCTVDRSVRKAYYEAKAELQKYMKSFDRTDAHEQFATALLPARSHVTAVDQWLAANVQV